MVNGSAPRPPSSIDTPSARSAEISAPIGRSRARGSPSNATEAGDSAATAGRNRMTVPGVAHVDADRRAGLKGAARDGEVRSILLDRAAEDPQRGEGKGCVAGLQTPRSRDGESLTAASISARLEIDLEPGSRKVARTGPCAAGARQRPDSITLRVSVDAEGVAHVRSVRLRS